MILNFLNKPLGLDSSPFGVSRKHSATALAAGIGATAVTASALGNLWSQAQTNKTNYKIWQEQRQYAQEQYERERLENRALIDEERAYNDPLAERERLLRAGINPALAKYGGSGSLSSVGVGSPPSSNVPDAPQQSPSDFSFISQTGDTFAKGYVDYMAEKELKTAQVEAIRQQNKLQVLEFLDKLEHSSLDKQAKRDLHNQAVLDYNFANDTYQDRKNSINLANKQIEANQHKLEVETEMQRLLNRFEPERQEAIRKQWQDAHDEVMSRIKVNGSIVSLNAANAELAKAQKDVADSVKHLNDLSAEEKDALIDLEIDALQQDINYKYWQGINSRQDAGSSSVGISQRGVSVRHPAPEFQNGSNYDPTSRILHRDRKGVYYYDGDHHEKMYVGK